MGHHRRPASTGGWFGRVIRWWYRHDEKARHLQRKADEALTAAQAQQPEVDRLAEQAWKAMGGRA